jgi:hypothetical protein
MTSLSRRLKRRRKPHKTARSVLFLQRLPSARKIG